MRRRAFVGTFAASALAAMLMLTIVYTQTSFMAREEISAGYSEGLSVLAIFDSASQSIQQATATRTAFSSTGQSINVTVSGAYPLKDSGAAITQLENYFTNDYPQYASANISADFSQIKGGAVRMLSNGNATFIVDANANRTGFEPLAAPLNTGITKVVYSYNLTTAYFGRAAWTGNAGTANVTVNIAYPAGYASESAMLDPSTPHAYEIYESADRTKKIVLTFGSSAGKVGVATATTANATAAWSISALMPYAQDSQWYYDATLNVTQGGLNRFSKIITYSG